MKSTKVALVAVFSFGLLGVTPPTYSVDCRECISISIRRTSATTYEMYDPNKPLCQALYDSLACNYDYYGDVQRTKVTYYELIAGQWKVVDEETVGFYYCYTLDWPGCTLPNP